MLYIRKRNLCYCIKSSRRLRNAKSNEIEDREILTQSFHANGISETVLFQMWNATEENLDKLVSALNV